MSILEYSMFRNITRHLNDLRSSSRNKAVPNNLCYGKKIMSG